MTIRSLTLTLAVLSILAGAAAVHSQELITNGTFETGIDGWTTLGGGGSLGWDPVGGNPGGAMAVTSLDVVTADCFPIPAVLSDITWSADVFENSGAACILTMAWFDTDDCTGSFLEPLGFSVATMTNTWGRVTLWHPQLTPQEATTFKPILVSLTTEACLFDNVSFVQTPVQAPAPPIPALGDVGLLILGGLVAAAGVLLLRRRP